MRIVLLSGEYSLPRAAKAAALGAAMDPTKPGMLMPTAADEAAAPVVNVSVPHLKVADFTGREGEFAHVLMMKKLAAAIATKPPAIALDGVTNTNRYSDLDAHGRGADNLTGAFAKALYWVDNRPLIVHFCLPSMKGYFVREWAKYLYYAPAESVVMWNSNTPHARVAPLQARAFARMRPFHIYYRAVDRMHAIVHRALRTVRLVPKK